MGSGRSDLTVDAYCSERSYLDHVLPVWNALPPDLRGQLFVAGPAATELNRLPAKTRHGQPNRRVGPPVIVASPQDHLVVRQRGTIFVEHGAGQTYGGDPTTARHPSYAGGTRRDNVRLFICPNENVARRNRLAYPGSDAVVVGCPKLDPWHRGERPLGDHEGVVAISFHADMPLCPETRSAFSHYASSLERLAQNYRVIGHAHPRWWPKMSRFWESIGVKSVRDFATVLDQADLYVCDNSSTTFEFASTGRPVIALNAPWYRRDVEHGLRFWSHVPGRQVDGPDELDEAITAAILEPWSHSGEREAAVREVYAFTDGRAAERAAQAVQDTI